MTKEEFAKKSFRHSEEIIYTRPESKIIKGRSISCLLVGIDFEQDLLFLIPFDSETYTDDPFWVRIEYCEKPKRKLKIAN